MRFSILLLSSICVLFIGCDQTPTTQLLDFSSESGVDYKILIWEHHTGMCAPISAFPAEDQPSLIVAVPSNSAFQRSEDQLLILWEEAPMRSRLVAGGSSQAYKRPNIEFQHALAKHVQGHFFYMYTVDAASITSFADDLLEHGATEAVLLPTGQGPNFVRYANAPFKVQRERLAAPTDSTLYVGVFPKK
jgi:hypothetical protein